MNAPLDKSRLNNPIRPVITPKQGPLTGRPSDASRSSPTQSTKRTLSGHLTGLSPRKTSVSYETGKAKMHEVGPATPKEAFDPDAFLAQQMVKEKPAATAHPLKEGPVELEADAGSDAHTLSEEHAKAGQPKRSIGKRVFDMASAINPVLGRVRTEVEDAKKNGDNVVAAGAKAYVKAVVDMGKGAVSAVDTLANSGAGLTAQANPVALMTAAATGAYLKASGNNDYAPVVVKAAGQIV